MDRIVTFQGNPLTLVGRVLRLNAPAPQFKTVSTSLKEVNLSDFQGKTKVITSFPSADTPVCDLQLKEFNKRAVSLSGDIVILGISKDLPFAQKRFCELNNIKNVTTLSDYKYSSFGLNYGLLIKELNLLARAVLVVDKNDILRYMRIVDEITQPPNYDDVLKNLEIVLHNSVIPPKEQLPGHCKPCEAGTPALSKERIEKLLVEHHGWQLVEDRKLVKEFQHKDFAEAKYFLDIVALIAEEQGHHPMMTIMYTKVKITLTTHASGGLTENDFIMAKIIDEVRG
ncbi:MAG: thiol peroxidase [Candidatus Omnitrophota bacterium]